MKFIDGSTDNCIICGKTTHYREVTTSAPICLNHEYSEQELAFIVKYQKENLTWGLKMATQVNPEIVAVIRPDGSLELYKLAMITK